MVKQCGNLRIWVNGNEAAAKLITIADVNQIGIVFGTCVSPRQQFFQHDGNFYAVGCRQGIQLQGMLADRQFLLCGGAGDGPIDAGKCTATFLIPGPDFGGCVLRHLIEFLI